VSVGDLSLKPQQHMPVNSGVQNKSPAVTSRLQVSPTDETHRMISL